MDDKLRQRIKRFIEYAAGDDPDAEIILREANDIAQEYAAESRRRSEEGQ